MIMFRSIHVAVMALFCSFLYIYLIFCIRSSVDRHLGCFHVLAIVNSAAVNIEVHVSFQIIVLSVYMPRKRIAGSYGSSIFSFFLFFWFLKIIYLFLAALGLCCCALASSSCSE